MIDMGMGMTDKQFSGFLRLLIDQLNLAEKQNDEDERKEMMKKIIDNLQKTLED